MKAKNFVHTNAEYHHVKFKTSTLKIAVTISNI